MRLNAPGKLVANRGPGTSASGLLGWKKLGWEEKLQARVVAYADDFVILCRHQAVEARKKMQAIMTTLKLTVNEQKTRGCTR